MFRRLTQNEFRAITDQINSDGGGSQTYIDLPKGKISDADLNSFFGRDNLSAPDINGKRRCTVSHWICRLRLL